MSFDGYFVLDGTEFANWSRFVAYAAGRGWWTPTVDDLAYGEVAEVTYTDPATDEAPWYDPDDPASAEFLGFYPLSVVGLEDSSRQGSVVESTIDGGVPGRIRHATKEVAFSGFIAGSSEEACEYGSRWLRRILLGGICSPLDTRTQALGVEMDYLAATPFLDDDEAESGGEVLTRLGRQRRRVAITRGPVFTQARKLQCGDVLWQVSFTATIGDPAIYRPSVRVLTSLFDSAGEDWGSAVVAGSVTEQTFDEVLCGVPLWQPLYDPLCSAAITPPAPPNVPLGCWTPPTAGATYDRTVVTIPAANLPSVDDVLPVLTITNPTTPLRGVRIRFYPDPDLDLDLDATPCAWVSDIVLSFIPIGTMVVDSSYEQVHVTTSGGHTRRADTLVFGTDQRPVVWPVLDCGVQYVMTVDVLGADAPPVMDLDFITRSV